MLCASTSRNSTRERHGGAGEGWLCRPRRSDPACTPLFMQAPSARAPAGCQEPSFGSLIISRSTPRCISNDLFTRLGPPGGRGPRPVLTGPSSSSHTPPGTEQALGIACDPPPEPLSSMSEKQFGFPGGLGTLDVMTRAVVCVFLSCECTDGKHEAGPPHSQTEWPAAAAPCLAPSPGHPQHGDRLHHLVLATQHLQRLPQGRPHEPHQVTET